MEKINQTTGMGSYGGGESNYKQCDWGGLPRSDLKEVRDWAMWTSSEECSRKRKKLQLRCRSRSKSGLSDWSKWLTGTVRHGANEVRQVKMEPMHLWDLESHYAYLFFFFSSEMRLHQMALNLRDMWPDCHASKMLLVPVLVLKLEHCIRITYRAC